jgi:hypothetical protein
MAACNLRSVMMDPCMFVGSSGEQQGPGKRFILRRRQQSVKGSGLALQTCGQRKGSVSGSRKGGHSVKLRHTDAGNGTGNITSMMHDACEKQAKILLNLNL